MAKAKKIGILGGTFNPIHLGHLVLAEQARELLGLERIIFMPAFLPPHKKIKTLAKACERHWMVAKAVKSNPSFAVSDLEIRRQGLSYTIDTVKAVKSMFPNTTVYFIVGSDVLKEFTVWRDIGRLSKICKFVIAQRPGFLFKKLPKHMRAIKVSALDISSTAIRKLVRTNKSIRYLVPEEVREYIVKKNLYRVIAKPRC